MYVLASRSVVISSTSRYESMSALLGSLGEYLPKIPRAEGTCQALYVARDPSHEALRAVGTSLVRQVLWHAPRYLYAELQQCAGLPGCRQHPCTSRGSKLGGRRPRRPTDLGTSVVAESLSPRPYPADRHSPKHLQAAQPLWLHSHLANSRSSRGRTNPPPSPSAFAVAVAE